MKPMTLQETVTLPNKKEMPMVSLGTWLTHKDIAASVVKEAISAGFRHIDTAQAYDNEEAVGRGIRESGVPRSEIFVTTKVAAEIKNRSGVIRSIESSLSRLGTGYIDLLLIHAPMPWDQITGPKRYFKENVEVWKVMEKFYMEGTVKAIGVSNFRKEDVRNILNNCTVSPMVDQIKIHPTKTNGVLCSYLSRTGVVIEAYSPLGHGTILNHPVIVSMAQKYEVSPGQLCVKYSLQKGYCPVVKTTSPEHMQQYVDLSSFNISQEDINILNGLGTLNKTIR